MGHNGTEAAKNINPVFGGNTVSERTMRFWFQKFPNEDFNLENQVRGQPKPSINDDKLKTLVENDPKASVREIVANFKVSIGTISNHLKAMGKQRKQI